MEVTQTKSEMKNYKNEVQKEEAEVIAPLNRR